MKFNSAFLFCEWNVIFDGPSNTSFHSQNKKALPTLMMVFLHWTSVYTLYFFTIDPLLNEWQLRPVNWLKKKKKRVQTEKIQLSCHFIVMALSGIWHFLKFRQCHRHMWSLMPVINWFLKALCVHVWRSWTARAMRCECSWVRRNSGRENYCCIKNQAIFHATPLLRQKLSIAVALSLVQM